MVKTLIEFIGRKLLYTNFSQSETYKMAQYWLKYIFLVENEILYSKVSFPKFPVRPSPTLEVTTGY